MKSWNTWKAARVMQKQGNGKSVVHNKPEYSDVQILLNCTRVLYHIAGFQCHAIQNRSK